jgi:copper homeostasis protein
MTDCKYKLEVIAFNIASCKAAEQANAFRIELCDNAHDGGTTPSYGFIKAARENLSIQLFPIIRPRGGDFLYSDEEFAIMCSDIKMCKDLGCDGIVFGILKADGTIDKERGSRLREMAYPLEVTFHRAFDRVNDPASALEDLIEMGCNRILTSGLQPAALQGAAVIAALIQQADDRITIMPGSGIRHDNLTELIKKTGAKEYHTSARTSIESAMHYKNTNMQENLQSVTLDIEEVKKIQALLNSMCS